MEKSIALKAADNIRILSAAMVEKAKSGHPGGAMGGADFINILYSEFLNFDPDDMHWPERDRFFLDPGHMSPMLYSILALTGNFTMNDLENFRQWESPTPGHPEMNVGKGIENTSGPLGQGHTMAVGAAITERFLVARFGEWLAHKTFTFISDGGIQEEISQGAGRLAGFLGLSNLVMFLDSNDIQLSTGTEEVSSENTAAKYEAWGWRVYTINGNEAEEIRTALKAAVLEKEKPVLIIGKTIMGKGCLTDKGESFERKSSTHGQPIGNAGASFEKTIENLGGNPTNPFQIFPEVEKYYKGVMKRKRQHAAEQNRVREKWEKDHPELSAKRHQFYSGEIPEIDFSKIEQKENIASRAASGAVLGVLANTIENMIISSADLSNSDKTDGFLKNTHAFTRNDFSGAFLQAGVSELTMASIMNGMLAHGGVIPAGGTFFVFSDYMKPAVRMAAIMELPVKYIWTHDAFRVGEDGPTHQPIEQEAQIRLLEHLKNHSGNRSVLVLRPADAAETSVAWKMALENTKTPTALILSRQGIKDLPPQKLSRFDEALGAEKGAYVVKEVNGEPELIMVGSGSEVSTLYEAASILKKENGIQVRVVSAISEGLFRDQESEYQEKILPPEIPTFGLTAGLPVTLAGLVGPNGMALGLESFGFSAPAHVLDEKLGYTGEQVAAQARKFIKSL
ncbi:MAG: transketolase [Bacteroidota bacterium]|nr:transketolase [Bacteroidota bacterium]